MINSPEACRRAFHFVELTMLMGFYGTLAFHVNAFDVDLPTERTEPLLPV